MPRKYLIFVIAAITLVACNFLPTSGSSSSKPTPRNQADLCRIVGLNPETEPVCHKTESWRSVLETAFPPKMATLEEVHAMLDPYREYSMPTSYGTLEFYRVSAGFLGPVMAHFGFNEDGIVESITIED